MEPSNAPAVIGVAMAKLLQEFKNQLELGPKDWDRFDDGMQSLHFQFLRLNARLERAIMVRETLLVLDGHKRIRGLTHGETIKSVH